MKYERLEARVSTELKKLFVKASAIKGVNLTNFIVNCAQKEAENIIRDNILIELSLQDKAFFLQSIDSSSKPNEKLMRAATKFKSKPKY